MDINSFFVGEILKTLFKLMAFYDFALTSWLSKILKDPLVSGLLRVKPIHSYSREK